MTQEAIKNRLHDLYEIKQHGEIMLGKVNQEISELEERLEKE